VEQLGRYEILSAIGTGGMGRVFRARIEGPAGASKQVALKVIHQHLSQDPDFVLMFLDEMRVAMALSHRNIVQTFDAGEVDGCYFMVMELVEGGSLRVVLDQRDSQRWVPPEIALFIASEVSSALDYAHRFQPVVAGQPLGVVHRDVSPSNILLSAEGDVKLADFGVAKTAGRLYVTSAGTVRGKMRYMAPEQAVQRATSRSDLFSLGAVLYELLTGEPLRRRGDLEEVSHPTRPPPPSSLRPGIPESLDALVLRCLDPDPAGRPASAAEVRRALAVESFRFQVRGSAEPDAHSRLRRFLLECGAVDRPAADMSSGPRSPGPDRTLDPGGPAPLDRLAAAVIARAQSLETDSRQGALTSEESDAASSMSTCGSTTRFVRGAALKPGSPGDPLRFWRTIFLVIATLVAAAIGSAWLVSRRRGAGESRPVVQRRLGPTPEARAIPATLPTAPPPRHEAPPDQPPPARASAAKIGVVRAMGYLDVNSQPCAQVYIDGHHRGETPLERVRLPAGVHTVRLVVPEMRFSRALIVRVPAGGRVKRVVDFNKALSPPPPRGRP
jgi:serine/threonine-protein kinase